MPKITFLPQNITVEAPSASPLLEAARLAGVSVETPCGAKGVCRKCLVNIKSGTVETKAGSYRGAKKNQALICQSNVADEDATVEIISGLYGEEGKFDDASNIFHVDGFKIDPAVKSAALRVAKPAPLDGLSDLDRLKKSIKAEIDCQDIKIPLGVLQKLPIELRKSEDTNVIYYMDGEILNIIDIADADMYGIAIDIGTTTVTVWLSDLNTGEIISRRTDYNAQVECGLDIITRINYAGKNLGELRERVLKTINGLIEATGKGNIYYAQVAGNTTMIHLFLGICPEYIRLDPYTPAVFRPPALRAFETGLAINPNAPVKFAPAVGSYVGGDITAGALCTPLCEGKSEIALFLDIGTNGEILLGNDEFILGCACSAGPAFEGGGIEFGMRASRGAIDDFKIGEGGEFEIRTIDNAPPAGICGSGMISLLAGMFRAGVVDAAGKFNRNSGFPLKIHGRSASIVIAPDGRGSGDHKEITVSEADIDNIIRAKAAIFSACRTLLNQVGMTAGDIQRLYIAGGFGRWLDLEDAAAIGLLPKFPAGKYVFLGNSALSGAHMCLLSSRHRRLRGELAARMTYIDLGAEPGYMDEYTAALFLPHTDRKLFE